MADVRPLSGRARLVTPPPPREGGPAPRARAPIGASSTETRSDTTSRCPPLLRLERAGDGFAYAAAGVDRRILRELERAARAPEATLDLHGRKSREAEASLVAFVRGAQSGGRRVVLVIHGRGLRSGEGGPVLRQLVHECLTQGSLVDAVLAVVAAPPRLGGSGAALVLLRRRT
jgi:DNA-nicking Smr family endonuclease